MGDVQGEQNGKVGKRAYPRDHERCAALHAALCREQQLRHGRTDEVGRRERRRLAAVVRLDELEDATGRAKDDGNCTQHLGQVTGRVAHLARRHTIFFALFPSLSLSSLFRSPDGREQLFFFRHQERGPCQTQIRCAKARAIGGPSRTKCPTAPADKWPSRVPTAPTPTAARATCAPRRRPTARACTLNTSAGVDDELYPQQEKNCMLPVK